jgi:hypothetical protein
MILLPQCDSGRDVDKFQQDLQRALPKATFRYLALGFR